MKIGLAALAAPLAGPLAVALAVALAAVSVAAAPAAKPPAPVAKPARSQCFWTRMVSGYAADNDRQVNVRVGARDVYQLDLLGPCQDIDWPLAKVALVAKGGGSICDGHDAEFVVQSGIGPQRCAVSAMRKLTPQQVEALPKKARP